jgi:ribosome-binding factor A
MSSRQSRTRSPQGRAAQSFRRERLETVVLEELRFIFRDDVTHPGLAGLRLLSLELSPDGSHARIAYAAPDAGGEATTGQATGEALEAASGFVRARLAQALSLKRVPRLGFTFVGLVSDGVPAFEGGES